MSRISYQPGMDPRPRAKDCAHDCKGSAIEKSTGRRLACVHNGFVGIPLSELRPAEIVRNPYTAADLKPAYDGRKGPRMWKAPRLKHEGTPFAPALGEVGSWVTWTERVERRSMSGIPEGRFEEVTRTGQVWDKAYPAGRIKRVCVVLPDQTYTFVAIEDLRPVTDVEQLELMAS